MREGSFIQADTAGLQDDDERQDALRECAANGGCTAKHACRAGMPRPYGKTFKRWGSRGSGFSRTGLYPPARYFAAVRGRE